MLVLGYYLVNTFFIIPVADDNLVPILKAVVTVNEWHSLGLELGLKKDALDRVEIEKKGNVLHCQKKMVSQWLDTGKATWRSLVEALMSPLVGKEGLANELAKEHSV